MADKIFTDNERKIMKILLDNARTSDVEISEQLHISPQAIGKIRKKLENNGIIKGYKCVLDFAKVGLRTFALLHVSIFSKAYSEFGGLEIYEKLKKHLRILFCCIPSDSEVSIICLFGFRNLVEMDHYFKKFKVQFRDYCEIKK
jgi:DNA-binding Lrp family transcriptional regulator